MELATVVEARGGTVIGPLQTVAGALAVLEERSVAAAILDSNLADRDITPVALLLADRGVPFVVHSGVGLPAVLARALPGIRLVRKPALPQIVIAHLLDAMSTDPRAS